MRIEQTHIDEIRAQFSTIKGKEDLVKLLSKARNLMYGRECRPVQLKYITYYADPKLSKKRYQKFTIKKKSGGERVIHAPAKGLKAILRPLNFVLQCMFDPHSAAMGFVNNRSIADNARSHVGHHYVLNMDLKDFFHSFDRKWVKYGFSYEPFNLNGTKEKEEVAFLISCLCTHPIEIDGVKKTVLPQGSPTSPTITNILCYRLDRKLSGLAKRFGVTYTRYADDITFSSPHNVYQPGDDAKADQNGRYDNFMSEFKRIINEENLTINPKKTRLQKSDYRQEVTGLTVNEKVNVTRRYVKQIRMWLYYWEKYGYDKAEQIFRCDYFADKGHVKNMDAPLINVLDGKLEYLKMVKSPEDRTYKGLKGRFDKLLGSFDPINTLLGIWEKEGIEKAMKVFFGSDNTDKEKSNIIATF